MNTTEQHERFEHWMRDHVAILYRVVKGFAEGDDCNDLMQEVMLAVWKAVPHFRGHSKPTTFLYRVSHNAALTWRRTRQNYRKHIEQAQLFSVTEHQLHGAAPQNELLEQLYSAIRTLPEVDRSLILLSLDGVGYDEMATIHGLSESNVGVKLNRIKQRLIKQLNERKNYELQ